MKMLRFSFVLLFAIILLTPSQVVRATSVTDFSSLTWSDEIEKDATYSWKVNNLSLNGTSVTHPERYGFINGAVIQIKVLVQLSEINLMDYINGTIEFPDPREFVELSVNGIGINFQPYNAIVFIVPSLVTIPEGQTNSFLILDSSNIVVFSSEGEYNPVSHEYTESDNSENSEKFVWDAKTGLLKSIEINHVDGFKFELSFINDANFTIDETPISTNLFFASIFTMIIIIRRKKN